MALGRCASLNTAQKSRVALFATINQQNKIKENEKWLDNGDLEVTVKVPAGMIMDFYDKLNSVTHGGAITEEIREE